MPAKLKTFFVFVIAVSATCPILGQEASGTARTQQKPATPRVGESTLRELAKARKLHIGAAVLKVSLWDDPGKALLANEFNMLVSENHMKWDKIHPFKDNFDWSFPDELAAFAAKSNMEVKGHALVWHGACPDYLKKLSALELKAEVSEHIQALVGRYKGQVRRWDVVNEALDDNGKGLRDSIFLNNLGPNYIEQCFRDAHKADPKAILIYNDYGCETLNAKSDRQFDMLKGLLAKKVPVHEVGLQMHTGFYGNAGVNTAELRKNVQRLTGLGLKVNISEMDIAFNNLPGNSVEERLKLQAQMYREILGAVCDIPGFSGVTFWGYSDKWTWLNWLDKDNPKAEKERPLLFDAELNKKPSYFSVQEVLRKKR